MNVFVYGTLMKERVFKNIAGITPTFERATISNFKRGMVGHAHFPGVIESINSEDKVDGYVVRDVSDAALARLDSYEGYPHLYGKTTAYAQVKDSEEPVQVTLYIFNDPDAINFEKDWPMPEDYYVD